MNCLGTAAEMLKDTTFLPDQSVSLAINMAEKLEHHDLRPPDGNASRDPSEPQDGATGDAQDQQEREG